MQASSAKVFFLGCFAIAVFSGAVLVEEGSLTTSDTNKRLAIAHSIWAGTREVTNYENVAVETPKGDRIQYLQSQILLMLPFDYVGHYLSPYISRFFLKEETWNKASTRNQYGFEHRLRGIFVAYLFFPALTVINAFLLFGVFRNLGLSVRQSLWGCIFAFVGTTYCVYLRYNTINSIQALCGLLTIYVLTTQISINKKLILGVPLSIFAILAKFTNAGFVIAYYLALWYQLEIGMRERRYRLDVLAAIAAASVSSIACWLLWHKYRFGLFYPTIMQLWAEKNSKFSIGINVWDFLTNFLSFYIDPAKSVFLHEPFTVVAIIVLLKSKIKAHGNLFVFAVVYLLLTSFIHGLTQPGWGNIFGSRYVNTHAMFISVLGIYYIVCRVKYRGLFILSAFMCLFYFLPSLFFSYHYDRHARIKSTRTDVRHIPSTIERPIGMYLYLFDKVCGTDYQHAYVRFDEQPRGFAAANRPLIGTRTMKRYLYRMEINEINYYMFRNCVLLIFGISICGVVGFTRKID